MATPVRRTANPRKTQSASTPPSILFTVEHVLDYIGPAAPITGFMGLAGWLMGRSERFDFGEFEGLVVGIVAGLFVGALIGIAVS